MSQVSIIDIEGSHPQIPTDFVADIGSATPIANTLEILGNTVVAGSLPVFTTGSGNTITTNVQLSQDSAVSNPLFAGLASFNESDFFVDANGFVSAIAGSASIQSVATTIGGPIFPNGSGQISIIGTVGPSVGAPLRSNGTVASTVNLVVQAASAQLVSGINTAGVASFDTSMFSVDANGYVKLIGGTLAVDSVAVQTGISPVVPTAAGLLTINGAVVAAGTNPVRTDGTGANTLAVEVQISQALAATDATKIGLCNFDSSRFSVDANGFVTLNAAGVVETLTGDSGGALNPTAGNFNILGRSGSKVSGAVSTLTVKSPPYSDAGASATSVLNTGEFVTGAFTRTLPVSAGLADGDLFEYVCISASALVIQAVGAQKIRSGTIISSAAGTFTSTAIGDSISLRFRATDGFFYATSIIGTWIAA